MNISRLTPLAALLLAVPFVQLSIGEAASPALAADRPVMQAPQDRTPSSREAANREPADREADRLLAKDSEAHAKHQVPLPEPLKKRGSGRVTKALDGDTLELKDGRLVRLACVDAPDLSTGYERPRENTQGEQDPRARQFRAGTHSFREVARAPRGSAQYYAKESRDALRKKACGQAVRLLAPAPRKDAQKRWIADVLFADGSTASRYLVRHGLAYYVFDPAYPEAYRNDLIRLQQEAIQQRLGFWDTILSLPEAKNPWIGDAQTRQFYANTDIRSRKVKPRQRVYFGNLLDAFSQGFAPARSTDFWPQKAKRRKK